MKKDRKVTFISGRTVWVSQEIAEVINKNIIKGCGKFQTFTNEHDITFLFVNLSEVESIQ